MKSTFTFSVKRVNFSIYTLFASLVKVDEKQRAVSLDENARGKEDTSKG